MARGRDAADVALTTTFGVNTLRTFQVWTDEVPAHALVSQMNVAGVRTLDGRPRDVDYRLVSRK